MSGPGTLLFLMALVLQAWAPRELALSGAEPSLERRQERPAGESQAFLLGVLRRDGLVSPFASFDGKRWTASWPEDIRFVELPISLDAVAAKWWGKAGVPSEMTVWADGARRGTLKLIKPILLPLMCVRRLALVSTYRPAEAAPPLMVQPYPKDGLVISGAHAIEAIEIVPRTSPAWTATAVSLLGPFDAAELLATRSFTDWKHPVSRAARRTVPVELETLYRAPMDAPGWTAFHVEAIKRYPPGPDDGDCGLVTYASGWIKTGPQGKTIAQLGAQITYCERRGNTFMMPFGVMEQDGRRYWIYQVSAYDREGYAITRPMPKENETQIQYLAGACF
jgi:hypothetical protein